MIVIHVLTLAQEIGVHRNTIRNWVNTGRISARPGPGKGLVFAPDDFERLCQDFNLDSERLEAMGRSGQVAAPFSQGLPPATVEGSAASRPG